MLEKLKEHDIIDPKTDKVIDDICGCLSVAKTKLQEVTFWANRGASYLGHNFHEAGEQAEQKDK